VITKEPADKTLRVQLDALNAGVVAALAARKAWMDARMEDFSNFKVGDEVYDAKTGALLGVVSKLYRYWGNRDPRYDTQMSIEIEYLQDGTTNCYDNSSRHAGVGPSFCTREEARSATKSRAEYLAWEARGSNWEEVFK
jgi:hypothetical protein